MTDQRLRSEFTDVDHAQSPADYVHMLDAQRSIPFIQQYKQRVRTLLDLHPGQQVLDAGTGTGEDAQEMAKLVAPGGLVVGLDVSQIMIDEAKRRVQDPSLPLRFVQGDIQHLPFEHATFDRCYADRTFIHLPDPQLALSELVRVTKPGGQILIAEGDHETQVLDTPYPDVTRRFFRFRNDGMEETPGSRGLFQIENPLLCFFHCDNAITLSRPHPFKIVGNRPDRFVVRGQACQRLYLDIEQTSILKEGIEPMGDIRLTHAIIAKAEETACHLSIRGIEDLSLMISFHNENLAARLGHSHQF